MSGEAAPPSSNTGGKLSPRHEISIDALAFSFVPGDDFDPQSFIDGLSPWFGQIAAEWRNRGHLGFAHSVDLGGLGILAFGTPPNSAASQRGRVWCSFMGAGCAVVVDWCGLAEHIRSLPSARLTRVDVAYDDYEGRSVNIDLASEWAKSDGFASGGNRPSVSCAGNWIEGNNRTLYVGSLKHQNGKLIRVYEKGQQLKDSKNPRWVRAEVQFTRKDREIPFEILVAPQYYIAGAAPAFSFMATVQARIKTLSRAVARTVEQVLERAKQAAGRALTLAYWLTDSKSSAFDLLTTNRLPARVVGLRPFFSELKEIVNETNNAPSRQFYSALRHV